MRLKIDIKNKKNYNLRVKLKKKLIFTKEPRKKIRNQNNEE